MAVAAGACPSCGAPIEFSVGASVAKVCDYCRSTVFRTDRELKDLGKVAAIANVPSLIAVGDEGLVAGRRMRVLGRVQLDQGEGPWDEWYVALDAGDTWAWLAYAEGIWFIMQRVAPTPAVPPFESLRVELAIDLPPSGRFIVGEYRTARVVSAEGELPAHFPPGLERRYADCHAIGNQFATIDYGSGGDQVEVFVGAPLVERSLRVTSPGPRTVAKVPMATMRCPRCGGDVPKLAGERAKRIACGYCGALTDIESQQVVAEQDAARETPPIPIGSKGTLLDESYVCIAYSRRSAEMDGERYSWEEQLLFSTDIGFRWLVRDDDTWLFVEPLNIAAVDTSGLPRSVRLRGNEYRLRNSSEARVDHVLGEYYWRCKVGETVTNSDFVRGDSVLSREVSSGGNEIHWSRSVPVPWRVLARAFGVSREPPLPLLMEADVAEFESESLGKEWYEQLDGKAIVGLVMLGLGVILLFAVISRQGDDDDDGEGRSTYGGSAHFYGGK